MLASNPQMATQAMLHHAQPALSASNEFDALQRAYMEYAAALRDPSVDASRTRLVDLLVQMQARGVYGNNALALLHKYCLQINWQGMSPDVFNSFYRFVYFICREPNKRNVQVSTAVAAWQLVLSGRFRLLERFCSFVSTHHKSVVILEDTWRQVLDFSRTVHEDLSNYDPASAWPVLLDEFVEHIKGARYANRPSVYVNINLQPLDMLSPWSVRPMTAVSPRSGSKRRPPDVHEVADQLQQLPLESADCARSGAGAATPTRMTLTAKRLRMGGSTDIGSNRPEQGHDSDAAAGPAPAEQPLGATAECSMHSRRVAGAAGGAPAAAFGDLEVLQDGQQQLEFTTGCMAPPAPHHSAQHHHHQHRVGMRAGGQPCMGSAGLGVRSSCQTMAPFGQQQLQQPVHQQQAATSSTEAFGRSSSSGSGSMEVSMDFGEQLRQHQQQQQPFMLAGPQPGVMQASAQLPPCPSPGHGGRLDMGVARRNVERAQSVNAMMQVTVTETLGFDQ